MVDITVHSPISNWLTRIESSRGQLIEAARSGNRVAGAFAMADARVDLIESLADEHIRARLLRMTDPSIAMVELANNPSDEDRIRICAIAILSGFCPGEDQFAIFGGGRNKDGSFKAGKLYIKEAGFRTLFAHLGIVAEVHTTHPEYVALGEAGKKVWRVGGSASCTYNGTEYAVRFDGDQLIGIPGYDSDNVAGISAKARRRILQSLWSMVSPILTTDQTDDDTETIRDTEKPAITEAPVTRPAETESTSQQKPQTREQIAAAFETARVAMNKRLSKDPGAAAAVMDLWKAIGEATTAEQLRAVGEEIKAAKDLHSERDLAELRRWYSFCGEAVQ